MAVGRDGNSRTSGHATQIFSLLDAVTFVSGTRSSTGTKTNVSEYDKFVATLTYGSWIGSGDLVVDIYACSDTDGSNPVQIGSSGSVKVAATTHINIPLLANYERGTQFVYAHGILAASSQGKATLKFYGKA